MAKCIIFISLFILNEICPSITSHTVTKYNCSSINTTLVATSTAQHQPRRGVMLKEEIRREKRQLTDAYYDFLINEGSFKFWAVFQMVTIAILLYSTFAAIYYAKYTYLHEQPNEEDGDIFLRSGRARTKRNFVRLLKAIHTPPR